MLNNFIDDLKFLPRKYKKLLLIISDYILIAISSVLCEFILIGYFSPISRSLVLYIFISIFLITLISIYKNNYSLVTKYLDTSAISSILFSSIFLALILFIIGKFINFRYFSLNFVVSQNLIFIFLTISTRIFFKYILYQHNSANFNKRNCLIFGASIEGIKFLNQNLNEYRVLGFIDEDINKIGTIIENKKVYSIADVTKIIKKNKISKLFICAKSISEFKKNEIFSIFIKYDIDIEFPKLNNDNFIKSDDNINFGNYENYFDNKTILITGCSGSIGQEIFLRLLNMNVKKIIGIDKNEETIAALKINLKKNKSRNKNYEIKLIDICNKNNCEYLFQENKFDIIFHAAAYKHVDIVEENPGTAIFNNIIGLNNILRLSNENQAEKFVFISTDKAVNPINIMRSTKRLGEIMTNYYKNFTNKKYISVRFGNVIGSSGSLLQILKKQLASGGPITLTDPKATRYFMTIKEAVSLVLKSTTIDDDGDIYVLKMGEPINIYFLMKQFLKNNNTFEKRNNSDGIEIKTIGLRPGEKLHEELFYNDASSTSVNSIMKENIYNPINKDKFNYLISKIENIDLKNFREVKDQISSLINDFSK